MNFSKSVQMNFSKSIEIVRKKPLKHSLPAAPSLPLDLYTLSDETEAGIRASAAIARDSVHHLPASLPIREAVHLAINASRRHHWARSGGTELCIMEREKESYKAFRRALCSAIFRNLPQILVRWGGLLCSTRLFFLYGEHEALTEMLTQGDPI